MNTISKLLVKNLLPVLLLIFMGLHSTAQTVTNYSFANTSGTFTALSGASTTTWTGNTDDAVSALIPIGFDFWYMGTRYSTLSASTNGWFSFGAVLSDYLYTNNLVTGGTPRPVIAPLWDDLDIVATSNVTYKTSGTAGSRIFTLQYLHIKWNYQASGSVCSFQVRLHEGSGKIEYIYRSDAVTANVPTASIGITAAATGAGNYLSVNSAGTGVSSTTETSITTKRATGATYSFTPPVPAKPASLTFTGVSNSAMTLNWTDLSSNESGFLIYRSTDNSNFSLVTQTAANTTTSAQTGLSDNTTYYWKIMAVSEGGVSTALSGSLATVCTPPASPTVTSPVAYCLNATATPLTATGTNLLWSTGSTVTGAVGGTATLSTATFVDGVNAGNNKKTIIATTAHNTTISSVDYYIPAWQAVDGLVLGIFDNTGTLIATSSTTTTQTAGATAIGITNIFNYTIAAAGTYSIGIVSGKGNIGSDNPAFPITESTGTINITGVSVSGYRCFNHIQFSNASSTAPIPATASTGSTSYLVTQTVNGCTSPAATIIVNVSAPSLSQLPTSGLIANYAFSGNANDVTGNDNGTLQNAPSLTTDRFGVADAAFAFNGSNQYISTAKAYNNPTNFTISIWFKTTTTTGGKLIGFGREQTGASGQYDRHIYMNNAGQLYFGIYSGELKTVSSVQSYNDNNWHLVTATLSAAAGMALYVDGAQVGSNAAGTLAENYTGYWRIGYDNNNAWTSQPSSFYFKGTLDDAVIYHRALTAAEIATVYTSPDGAGNNGPACTGTAITLSATTLSGASYAWTGPNSYTAAVQNPSFTYSPANAGVYTVKVTVNGCTATAYTNVTSSTNAGQWTGNVSTDWSNASNWCTGTIPTAATDVVIASTATRMPLISSTASCNSLTINAGATLTIDTAGTIKIAGMLTNNGTVTNNGSTVFNGTSGQQTFSGVNTFYNLTVNNSNGMLLPEAITINNNLTITTGALNANNFNIAIKGNWTNNSATAAYTGGTATVTFNGAGVQRIGGPFVTTFNNLTITSTAGTVTLDANIIIDGNLTVSTGIFDLGSYTANRSSPGGVLMVANNATLKIGGTNTFPENYTTNTLVVASHVEYAGAAQNVANQNYGNLIVSSASGTATKTFPATAMTIHGNLVSTPGAGTAVSFTAGGNITINGNVIIGASTTFNAGAHAHSINGNWTNNGTFNGNTGTVSFTGAGTTVGGSGNTNFNNLTIAGSLISFTAGNIALSGNLSTTGAGSFSQVSGATLLMTGAGTNISGTGISLDNLTITGSVTTNAAMNLSGNLLVSGSLTTGTATFTMSGTAKTMTGAGAISFGSLSVTGTVTANAAFSVSSELAVNGSLAATAGTATFTGYSTLSGTADLYNVTINGTSLQLSANARLGIANTLAITAGALNVTTSIPNTVNFNGTGAQAVNAITYCNLILSGGGTKTAQGDLTTNYDITIGTGTTFNPSSYTHTIYGSWNNNGSFIPATSTVAFMGAATAYVRGATTFNVLTSHTTNASTQLVLQSHVSAAIVNMTNGTISTGQDTITITNTRTGNGKIEGNIQRTHAFTTGVAYAFKDPYNSITFTSVSAVTNITVSIINGNIDDFPFQGSINEECRISVPVGTYDATLSFGYEDAELNGHNESSMALWKYSGSSWTAIGKTTYDVSLNYVTKNSLTDISGRWTLSDAANHVRWNGSVSSDWHTAANWTAISGSPSRPPAATDIVDFGTTTFNFQPTISAAAAAKNIIFGSAKAVTLTIAAGGSLTTSGNMAGTWTAPVTHTINVNNQTMTINGDVNLGDATTGHAIDLSIGTGIVNIGGSITQDGGSTISFVGAGTLNLAHNFEHNNGTFNSGAGTVVYNGDDNQHIAHINYNNLTINKASGLAKIDSASNIMGDLLIASGQLDNLTSLTIAGNVTLDTGTTLNDAGVVNVGGNWTNQGTYIGTGAQVKFNGTGTQTISASGFNNIVINKPVGSSAVLAGDIVLNGDLTILSGTFNVKTFLLTRTVLGGTITLADSATVIVGGNNVPVNFSAYTYSRSSTLILDGTMDQSLGSAGGSFGNVVFRNTGIKNVVTSISVRGNLTIGTGTSLNCGANTITLDGSWVNNGTFIPATSTLLFTGTGQTISGNTTFNNATVTGSYTVLHDMTFNTLLDITSTGSLSGGSSIHTTMNGDLINRGVLYTLGTTTYTGTKQQTLRLVDAISTVALTVNFNGTVSPVLNSTSAPQFGYLNINNTGGVNPSVDWTVLYAFNVGSGASFNGGISTHDIMGSLTNNGTITSNGRINFTPAATTTVDLGVNFSSIGIVAFGGAGALTLAGTADSFRNVIISNTNAAGIAPAAGWIISNTLTVNSGSTLQAGNHTYTVGGNIMNSGAINSGASTFIIKGNGQQTINTPSAFNNLTINKSAGMVALLDNATVNGVINFISGRIQTGIYRIILPASGSVIGAAQSTGWVYGKLQKNISTGATIKQFEVGDELNYTPVDIVFSNVTSSGSLTASSIQFDHPQISSSAINASRSVNRYWELTSSDLLFNDYNATFHFVASDVDAGTSGTTLIAGRYSDRAWSYPAVGAITPTSVQATGLTAFIDFQIGERMIYIKTWDGGAGTRNWSDAANWNNDEVPTTTDNVELTRADTIDIDVAAVALNLLINNNALILSVQPGKSLNISDNFTLLAGTFNTAAAFPSATGLTDVSGGTVGFNGSSTQSIPALQYRNLISSSTGNRLLPTGVIGINGAFSPGTNHYVITGSTIEYNGNDTQNIATFNYQNLTLSNAGGKSFGKDTTGIAGVLSIGGTATPITDSSTISYNGSTNQVIVPITYFNLNAANATGTVTITDATVNSNLSITKGTLAIGNDNTARTITVNGNIDIAAGAALQVAAASDADHQLILRGNVTNNGLLDLRPDANSLCDVTVNKEGVQTISGVGGSTNFNHITVNQGTTNSNYLEINAVNFSAPDGFLTLNNGTFALNSAGIAVTPFTADITTGNYLVPASAGLLVNAGTIRSAAMNWTVAGLVKITGGVLNMGTVTDNAVIPKPSATFAITAGNLNLASRISNPGSAWTFLMKGGTTTVNSMGSSAVGTAPFNMDVPGCLFDMSGGQLVIQQAGGSATEHLGYNNVAITGPGFTGGALVIGNTATPALQTMTINSAGPIYNLVVNSAHATALLSTDLTVSNDVSVSAGKLDVNICKLKVGGGLVSNRAVMAANGGIEFNGLVMQTIPAAAFAGDTVKNITINNTAGVSLQGNVFVSGILLAAKGPFNTGGFLTLVSTASQTALIDGSGLGDVLGNVTVQRYFQTGFGYKYVSSPFQGATVNEFADDINLSATFPTFYRYDENLLSTGWIRYTGTAGSLDPGAGYAANLGTSATPVTVDMTGVVNNNTIVMPALYNHNRQYTQGFNLVGNPYASPVDWEAASGWARTNIDNAVYYFDAGATNQYTGTYSSYINGVSSNGIANGIIPAMQGFFVHVSAGTYPVTASLSVNNHARINNLVPDFHRRSAMTLPLLRLSARFDASKAPADPVVIYFDDADGKKTFDREMDALKIMNTDSLVPNLYVIAADTSRLSICGWTGMQDTADIIPLGLQTLRTGWINLQTVAAERFPASRRIYLYDAKTGASQDIQSNPQYRVFLNAGVYTNRFFLLFRSKKETPTATPGTIAATFDVYNNGNRLIARLAELPGEKCTMVITTPLGQVMMRRQLEGNGMHELGSSFKNGVYIISLYTQQQVVSKKIFIGN